MKVTGGGRRNIIVFIRTHSRRVVEALLQLIIYEKRGARAYDRARRKVSGWIRRRRRVTPRWETQARFVVPAFLEVVDLPGHGIRAAPWWRE